MHANIPALVNGTSDLSILVFTGCRQELGILNVFYLEVFSFEENDFLVLLVVARINQPIILEVIFTCRCQVNLE